jgi:hypothetical protein
VADSRPRDPPRLENYDEEIYGPARFSTVRVRRLIAALLALAPGLAAPLAGCAIDPHPANGTQLSPLDLNYFACNVQRPLIRRCSMLACHGATLQAPDGNVYYHALRIYSPGKLRLVPASTMSDRDSQLTVDELNGNYSAALGLTFGAATPDEVPLLRKPLSPSAGGGEHKGGALFVDQSDADYVALFNWVTGSTQPAGCDLLNQIQGTM